MYLQALVQQGGQVFRDRLHLNEAGKQMHTQMILNLLCNRERMDPKGCVCCANWFVVSRFNNCEHTYIWKDYLFNICLNYVFLHGYTFEFGTLFPGIFLNVTDEIVPSHWDLADTCFNLDVHILLWLSMTCFRKWSAKMYKEWEMSPSRVLSKCMNYIVDVLSFI